MFARDPQTCVPKAHTTSAVARFFLANLRAFFSEDSAVQSRSTNLVLAAIHALSAGSEKTDAPANQNNGGSKGGFTQSDISAYLRAHGEPMSAWEVRGELTSLERAGAVRIESATAIWYLTTASS